MSSAAIMVASLAATAISTGIGVYSSIKQGQAQQAQAEYQSKVAQRNADLAEQQASAQRMQGYENMQAQRLKTARLIGQQRAQAGASGVAVDSGSFEDVAEDTKAAGEFDAINAYNSSIDKAYNTEIQAWNYESQAAGYQAQADAAGQSSMLNAIGTGIGGIAQMGSTWAKFDNSPSSTNKGFIERFGDYSAGKVRRY